MRRPRPDTNVRRAFRCMMILARSVRGRHLAAFTQQQPRTEAQILILALRPGPTVNTTPFDGAMGRGDTIKIAIRYLIEKSSISINLFRAREPTFRRPDVASSPLHSPHG